MVREGEKVSIHSWSMAEQKWTKIGDVVGAAGGSEVREYGTFPVGLFKQYGTSLFLIAALSAKAYNSISKPRI
jgi:hypothetical protein